MHAGFMGVKFVSIGREAGIIYDHFILDPKGPSRTIVDDLVLIELAELATEAKAFLMQGWFNSLCQFKGSSTFVSSILFSVG